MTIEHINDIDINNLILIGKFDNSQKLKYKTYDTSWVYFFYYNNYLIYLEVFNNKKIKWCGLKKDNNDSDYFLLFINDKKDFDKENNDGFFNTIKPIQPFLSKTFNLLAEEAFYYQKSSTIQIHEIDDIFKKLKRKYKIEKLLNT